MPAREYGILCLTCKRFITMGEVELRDKAQLTDLRRALSEQGEQGGSLQCPYCGAENRYGPNALVLLDSPQPPPGPR
jgi:hypothetical protein